MPQEHIIAGKYQVLRRLASGGMGTVYLAKNLRLGAQVALKVLLPQDVADPTQAPRFEREARIASRLRSPHCVRVYDVETGADGELVIVMEYLEGRDLETMLRQNPEPIPRERAVDWLLQVCSAMDEAHALGIVHRDLKPANLFVTSPGGIMKVVDFGLSKQYGEAGITGDKELLGTPQYMSPEQFEGASVNAQSDVWSLCVVAYRLLNGRMPFEAKPKDSIITISERIIRSPPIPMNASVPPLLAATVMRGLERDKRKRFASVRELARGLEEFASPRGGFHPYGGDDEKPLGDEPDAPTMPATAIDERKR